MAGPKRFGHRRFPANGWMIYGPPGRDGWATGDEQGEHADRDVVVAPMRCPRARATSRPTRGIAISKPGIRTLAQALPRRHRQADRQPPALHRGWFEEHLCQLASSCRRSVHVRREVDSLAGKEGPKSREREGAFDARAMGSGVCFDQRWRPSGVPWPLQADGLDAAER
jgi:hypothetical protein